MNIWQISGELVNHRELPDEVFEKNAYRKFSINRYFSKCVSTLFIAEDASLLHVDIPKDIHAKFISMSCEQGTKMKTIGFSKKENTSDVLSRIMDLYHVNKIIAGQYLKLLKSSNNLGRFMKKTYKGGQR